MRHASLNSHLRPPDCENIHKHVKTIEKHTGCNDTLAPLPQPKLKVAQYNQTYCRKVKSISAMDFQYFCFVSIFASFFMLSNKKAKVNKN